MWEVIEKNKKKSIIALFIMAIWYSFIYGIICILCVISIIIYILTKRQASAFIDFIMTMDWIDLLIVGMSIAFFIFIFRFFDLKDRPYNMSGAYLYKVDKKSNETLCNIVEEMAIASGSNYTPDVYILNSKILNAYACGLTPQHASIVVSTGLLEILDRDELQGVIAHEMSHIVNRDTTYLLCSGALYNISAAFSSFFWGSIKSSKRHSKGSIIILLLALLSSLGQGICFLLFMFISRKREYLADACASQYTRYPKGLADALLKIQARVENSDDYIVEPDGADKLIKASFFMVSEEDADKLTSTHPSTTNRIKVLLNMKTADYLAYEKSFKALNKKSIIPESVINKTKTTQIKNTEKQQKNDASVIMACALDGKIKNNNQVQKIRENKDIIDENIKKHREVCDMVHRLQNFAEINCSCGTKLKIPPEYHNKIVICPHCKTKHFANPN